MTQVVDDDALTLGAVGVVAACLATAAHFALGHAGACLAVGGQVTLLTTVHFSCTSQDTWTVIGGPLGSLAAGGTAWLLWTATKAHQVIVRQILLITMSINLYWLGGGLFYSALVNGHDWYFILVPIEMPPGPALRAAEAAAGAIVYAAAIPIAQSRAVIMAVEPQRAWARSAIAWLGATVAACAAAALYAPHRLANAWGAAWEVGAWSLPLLAPVLVRAHPGAGRPVQRSLALIGAALAGLAAMAVTMGVGMP